MRGDLSTASVLKSPHDAKPSSCGRLVDRSREDDRPRRARHALPSLVALAGPVTSASRWPEQSRQHCAMAQIGGHDVAADHAEAARRRGDPLELPRHRRGHRRKCDPREGARHHGTRRAVRRLRRRAHMAILGDPQDATLSVHKPRAQIGAGPVNAPGAPTWNDLVSPDLEACAAFYRDLFEWGDRGDPGLPGASTGDHQRRQVPRRTTGAAPRNPLLQELCRRRARAGRLARAPGTGAAGR
jgi:hypothetical protein